MNQKLNSSGVKIIKPSYLLRAKIGTGFLSLKIIERCRRVFDSNTVDFAPMAMEELDRLEIIIAGAKSKTLTRDEAAGKMTEIIMQLKANASMFNYPLVSRLAAIMLGFLESMKEIDDNAIEIVSAHHKTLKVIIAKKMSGDGGVTGRKLEEELTYACARYFKSRF